MIIRTVLAERLLTTFYDLNFGHIESLKYVLTKDK